MATFPSSDASSPAVDKVSNQTANVSTAQFTPPIGYSIVVGFTSDADTHTGATPTIAHTGTAVVNAWTREDSIGHGSVGEPLRGACRQFGRQRCGSCGQGSAGRSSGSRGGGRDSA